LLSLIVDHHSSNIPMVVDKMVVCAVVIVVVAVVFRVLVGVVVVVVVVVVFVDVVVVIVIVVVVVVVIVVVIVVVVVVVVIVVVVVVKIGIEVVMLVVIVGDAFVTIPSYIIGNVLPFAVDVFIKDGNSVAVGTTVTNSIFDHMSACILSRCSGSHHFL
jgi:hypothetical protein